MANAETGAPPPPEPIDRANGGPDPTTVCRVAVLMACHNRRETTLQCLERLDAQDLDSTVEVRVFLVDDGSTDGTAEAVRARFPKVRIIAGSGDLYWCGGMRHAFDAARSAPESFAFFLWLNDDTDLTQDAIRRLLATHEAIVRQGDDRGEANGEASGEGDAIVVGSVTGPSTGPSAGRLSYGGLKRLGPLPFTRLLAPTEVPQHCDTFCGNFVLIPEGVARVVGPIDPALRHLRGDIDYGLRARALGVAIWVAPGYYGTCEPHPVGAWRDTGLTLRQRLALLREPKYAFGEKILVARRHYGLLWFLSPLAVYGYLGVSHLWATIRRPGSRRRGSRRR